MNRRQKSRQSVINDISNKNYNFNWISDDERKTPQNMRVHSVGDRFSPISITESNML